MNSINDALQRTYNTNVTQGKRLFVQALAPSFYPKSEQQAVADALNVLYPGLSYNDAMYLYLNNSNPYWSGVLVCSDVLQCAKVIQC